MPTLRVRFLLLLTLVLITVIVSRAQPVCAYKQSFSINLYSVTKMKDGGRTGYNFNFKGEFLDLSGVRSIITNYKLKPCAEKGSTTIEASSCSDCPEWLRKQEIRITELMTINLKLKQESEDLQKKISQFQKEREKLILDLHKLNVTASNCGGTVNSKECPKTNLCEAMSHNCTEDSIRINLTKNTTLVHISGNGINMDGFMTLTWD